MRRQGTLLLAGILGLGGCSFTGRVADRVGDSVAGSLSNAGVWATDLMTGANKPDDPAELVEFEVT